MTIGEGKYDAICTQIREDHNADAVVVVIINGHRGTGFSVQASPIAMLKLPDAFHNMAEEMRRDVEKMLRAGVPPT